jgi:hypothetical protein
MDRRLVVLAVMLVAAWWLGGAQSAAAQWSVSSADGKSTLNLGFLSQIQYEAVQDASGGDYQQNVFFRRLRAIAGGRIGDRLSFYFNTDSPNLGKGTTGGAKNTDTLYVQDFSLTYTVSDAFKVDAGMLLVPVSHNAQQGATSLLAVDFGPYTFTHGDPLDSKAGRDYGVGARGFLANNHVEYRAGVYQGNRSADAAMPLRTTVRVAWYPFEADTGFFYTGTTLGKKRIWSLGASYDRQQDYTAVTGDVFIDQPLGNGDALTLQLDLTRYDGGETLATLPEQTAALAEAGYYVHALKLGAFVQYGRREFADGAPTQSKLQGGVTYWPKGHAFNLKLAWAVLEAGGAPDRNQLVLQWQVFAY